ncbi:DUF6624 domain-containing protein [Puia sp.]|jgi:hypothetical protein|uniref:DUF6624 domain-containing protein n=1 Tax=Puia sp. TaxID=2045100 RepID=UPI002F3F0162
MKKAILLLLLLPAALLSKAQTPRSHPVMDSIMSQLAYVFKTDQQYRAPLESTIKKYGWNSPQVDSLEDLMSTQDSINLGVVTHIIDTYGWIGPDSIGPSGSTTLWIVIQHSDLGIQQKYLPLMRAAVRQGRAHASELAYLEDRVALEEGKKQLYGTQFRLDTTTNKYIVSPIEDEPNVDKRRAAVGLPSLEAYARENGITYRLPPPPPKSQPDSSSRGHPMH